MKLIIISIIAFNLFGCAHWDLHLESQSKKYMGQPVENMYDEYGAPINSAALASGGYFIQFQHFKGGFQCSADVKTNREGNVIYISVGGQNGCITGKY